MKKYRRVGAGLTAGAFFLIGTLAVAQTPQKSKTTNPRGAADVKPGSGASAAQYKDSEDISARYRPGNNKTARNANDTAAPGAGAAQPEAVQRKHIAGVKYENRVADDNTGGANVQGTTAGQSAQGAAERKSGSIIVLDREGQASASGKGIGSAGVPGREAQTGQASGNLQRKNGAINSANFPRSANAKSSAHATESLSPSDNAKKGENPLYEDSGKSGTNPLYESGKLTATKPNTQNPPAQGKETKFKQDFGQVQPSKKQ